MNEPMILDRLLKAVEKADKNSGIAVLANDHVHTLERVIVCVKDPGLIFECKRIDEPASELPNLPTDTLALEACKRIVDVRSCMMFQRIHAEFAVKEILDRYGVASIDLLAAQAQDMAEQALKQHGR